ncbi:MAG: NAD(P)/FAD-dependent oxidoreductase [Planctomycetota bacterium]
MAEERYDTLVIGAGLSGLAAGIRLAMFGKRVAVLERHYLWGGLNSFYKRGGRLFDSGMHAMTNYVPKGTRGTPLARVCKQLRIRHEELDLRPQVTSSVVCGGASVRFSNDEALLIEEVAQAFPHCADRFAALVEQLRDIPLGSPESATDSTRARLMDALGDPHLVDLILVPTCYYGSARENDVDWDQFVILFRSIFLEGLAIPGQGIRPFLQLFVDRLKTAGGELRLKSEVARVRVNGGRARGVELTDGTVLEADSVISSAGWVETMNLCGEDYAAQVVPADRGRLSFVETISALDRWPTAIDPAMDSAVIFFSTGDRFRYEQPAGHVDLTSGVVSMPTNYAHTPADHEGLFRVTVLANHDAWVAMEEDAYVAKKQELSTAALGATTGFCADVRPHEVFRDVFTPRTVHKYTAKLSGAIYGSPNKRRDGSTPIANLSLCGTDQGFLGVIGAAVSGIAIATQHATQPA